MKVLRFALRFRWASREGQLLLSASIDFFSAGPLIADSHLPSLSLNYF